MTRIGVAGHVCLDLTPHLDRDPGLTPGLLYEVGAMAATAGGCVANTGGQLADLGLDVALFADIGDDELAPVLRDAVTTRGLDASGFRATAGSTSYSVVVQAPHTDRTFWHHVGANRTFDGSAVHLDGIDLLHVGYPPILPGLVADDGRPLIVLFERAHAAGLVTSLDLAVVSDPDDESRARWTVLLKAFLPHTDVVTPSVDDLISATGAGIEQSPAGLIDAARSLVAQGAGVAAVSAGPNGIALATGSRQRLNSAGTLLARLDGWADETLWLPASRIETPVTTTGAGDAATAGFVAALVRGATPADALAASGAP
jgi:sugar/nucleoside kinase (ribokinase family)